ncbi:SDR family oxidoreductase [Candidatus Nitrosopumilus sp. SW]|uniref:SDR family oxidoreductase n=1 Tax=Candidatus Nitrosopumilus sp. SW TaxID=2508726 RepID=UPI0011500CDA|nr:SDR family oxidoreductase [Candidatus Nitrosopumilus sp. SW]QDI88790.1 SDR family oxidoreductase [Candidatus Nitrosopumilus sp. SW]
MKKLFIFGMGGLVGYRISILAKNKFEIYGSYNERNPQFTFASAQKINILEENKVKKALNSINPDYVVITSALTNVDYCESHSKEAKKVNVDAVKNIFEICEQLNCKVIYISSDSVFDGTKKSPYLENDKPEPINYYGKTKLDSEKIILKNPNNLVVRASVLYGWLPSYLSNIPSSSMKDKNFAQWLIQKLMNEESVNIITDEISSPILADDLAKSIIHLIREGHQGLFHSAPSIQISRFDFSIKMAKHLSLNENLIHPVSNKELGRDVTTGNNKCLDSKKIQKETGFTFLDLDESFNKLKNNIEQDF